MHTAILHFLTTVRQAMEIVGGAPLAAFLDFARAIVAPAMARVGWEPVPGEEEVQYSTVQYSIVQYSTLQFNSIHRVEYSTVQYSALQYNT